MEKLSDAIGLTFKILVALIALRALIMFAGVAVEIPLVDPIFFAVRDALMKLGSLGWRILAGGFGR